MSTPTLPENYRHGELPFFADGMLLAMREEGHVVFQFFAGLPDGTVYQRPVMLTKQTLAKMAELIGRSLEEDAKPTAKAKRKAAKR